MFRGLKAQNCPIGVLESWGLGVKKHHQGEPNAFYGIKKAFVVLEIFNFEVIGVCMGNSNFKLFVLVLSQ